MELKFHAVWEKCTCAFVLIVPYGIEISETGKHRGITVRY